MMLRRAVDMEPGWHVVLHGSRWFVEDVLDFMEFGRSVVHLRIVPELADENAKSQVLKFKPEDYIETLHIWLPCP